MLYIGIVIFFLLILQKVTLRPNFDNLSNWFYLYKNREAPEYGCVKTSNLRALKYVYNTSD